MIMTKKKREEQEKQFRELVNRWIEGSFLKQQELFEKDKKTKALYEKIKKKASF